MCLKMLKVLILILFLNNVISEPLTHQDLKIALEETTEFFRQLKLDYAKENQSENAPAELDSKINEYIKMKIGLSSDSRKRRETFDSQLQDKGILILSGLEDVTNSNLTNIKDIAFFSFRSGIEPSQWFAAILNSSELSLYRIEGDKINLIRTYQHKDYRKIIASSCSKGTLFIVEREKGAIVILRFSTLYVLERIQDFVTSDVKHITTWHGMNQLHLGIATSSNISIYTWLGEHFDLVQVITTRSTIEELTPFYSKGFMHLAATGSATLIFRYSLRSNNFEAVQSLPESQRVSSFQLNEGRFTDHFLCLSKNDSIIIYKELHDRFLPFHRISTGGSMVSLIVKKAVILFSLHENTLIAHQYDGWRFVPLSFAMTQVKQVQRVVLYDEEYLLIEYSYGVWQLKKPSWILKKSWRDLQEEIGNWCIEAKSKAKRTPEEIPKFEGSLKIRQGHIQLLQAHKINGHDAEESLSLSKKYEELSRRLKQQEEALSGKKSSKDPVFKSLSGKKIQVKCDTTCRATRVNTEQKKDPFERLKNSEAANSIVKYKTLRIKDNPNLLCPVPAVPMKQILVKNLTNGFDIENMEKKLLKINGDQVVTGIHTIQSIEAKHARIPLDIASKSTRQVVRATELRVKELNLLEGGLLLPLDGPPTTITGSIKARKVKLNRLPEMRSHIWGLEKLKPSTLNMEPLRLVKNCTLERVTIENLLHAKNFISSSGQSLVNIVKNAISLDERNIPVSLRVSAENMKWTNVSLPGGKNWVTSNEDGTSTNLIITGKKRVQQDVIVTEETYNNLPLPKIHEVNATSAIMSEITTSTLEVESLNAIGINASRVFGELKEDDASEVFDSPAGRVYDRITVENMIVKNADNTNLKNLEDFLKVWKEPNIYGGSINVDNLTVDALQYPVQFPLPLRVQKFVSKGNMYVGTINGISLVDFLADAVKITDTVSLGQVLFEAGLSADSAQVQEPSFNLSNNALNSTWRTKEILTGLKTNSIQLPYSFEYDTKRTPSVYIQGSAKFAMEPLIANLNGSNLQELLDKVWMKNRSTYFPGSNLHIYNATMESVIILKNNLTAPNLESWRTISERVLSKSKPQEIRVPVLINTVEVPFVLASKESRIVSNVSDLNDMLENALTKVGPQVVKAKWMFDKLIATDKLNLTRKLNNMYLDKDVLRHDRKNPVITGKKMIMDLAVKELHGLDFDKWSEKVLTRKTRKLVTVKGRKTFRNVSFSKLRVFGTVKGKKLSEALLKSKEQEIVGPKKIVGHLNAPGLNVDGLINDVNLTNLVNSQLKRHQPSQRIESEIEFLDCFEIIGNLTIKGLRDEGEVNSVNATGILEAIDAIDVALENRAFYVKKFQSVPIDSIASLSSILQENTAEAKIYSEVQNITVFHNDQELHFPLAWSPRDSVLIKSDLLNEIPVLVSVKRDNTSIHIFNEQKNQWYLSKDLYIPGVIDAFVESGENCLWLGLRLETQTVILRYDSSGDLQKHFLPRTEVLRVNKIPNNQLLLVLSNGIWNLEGVGEPKKILHRALYGKIETFQRGLDYYVKSTRGNNSVLLKARYTGN